MTAAIPTLPAIPWLGAPRRMLTNPGAYLMSGYRRLGPVFRFRLVGMEMVALLGPDANRLILVTERERFSHGLGYQLVREMLGDGLLFQDGAVHRRNRSLMTPAFHQKAVNGYLPVMEAVASAHLARWADEGAGSMYERLRALTFDVMARLVLGVEADADLERLGRLNDDLARGSAALLRVGWPWTTYGRGLRARDALREYLRGVIRRRRGTAGTDALGLLLAARDDDGETLRDEDILEQGVILMFAGHETTTSMLTSFLRALRLHPEWRERLVAEHRRVVGDAPLTPERLRDLTELDLVLKEVERLWPPISLCQRGVVDPVEFAGHRLEPGTNVVYSPWVTHRLEAPFADPERFDPERFAPPREEHRATPYALVGFGGGPRLCIGQAFALLEMKVTAALLLGSYDWSVEDDRDDLVWVPTVHPRGGLPGAVRHR